MMDPTLLESLAGSLARRGAGVEEIIDSLRTLNVHRCEGVVADNILVYMANRALREKDRPAWPPSPVSEEFATEFNAGLKRAEAERRERTNR